MDKPNIFYHNLEDIDIILQIVKEISLDKTSVENAPWIRNLYFAGRTLFIDMYSDNKVGSMTFCHADEDVGFFYGGFRKLLSIKSCKLLEEIMVINEVRHTPKWLKL